MKKLLLTLLTTTLFQNPAFAQLSKSDAEIYTYGKMRGVVFCTAFRMGAKTTEDVVNFRNNWQNANLEMSDLIFRYSDQRQKKVFQNGWYDQMMKDCPNETQNFYRNK